MRLTTVMHGYPPLWAMGGEVSTHRTIRTIPDSRAFIQTVEEPYELDGVEVRPLPDISILGIATAIAEDLDAVFTHSSLSEPAVRAARKLRKPSLLGIHAPRRFAPDLIRAARGATVRIYNTDAAKEDWRDPSGWVLHPPAVRLEVVDGPRDAYTLASSLVNKGSKQVLELAKILPDKRFIIVRSPAEATHGLRGFEKMAAALPNVEVWDRLEPHEMGKLWSQTRIVLVPSNYETYGLVAVEAAWWGIPSVHVNTPHVLEGIGNAARLLTGTTTEDVGMAIMDIEADYQMWANSAEDRAIILADREKLELERFAEGVSQLTPDSVKRI